MKKNILDYVIVMLTFFSMIFVSQKSMGEIEGEITKRRFSVGDCEVVSMTVKYRIGTLLGEPTVNGAFKWEVASGSKLKSLPYDFAIWLKIAGGSGGGGYIGLKPTIPDAGSGYGWNIAGSPNWDDFICGFDGNKSTECMSPEQAKKVYKNGRIVSFKFSSKRAKTMRDERIARDRLLVQEENERRRQEALDDIDRIHERQREREKAGEEFVEELFDLLRQNK